VEGREKKREEVENKDVVIASLQKEVIRLREENDRQREEIRGLKEENAILKSSSVPVEKEKITPEATALLPVSKPLVSAEKEKADVPREKIEKFDDYLKSFYEKHEFNYSALETLNVAKWQYFAMLVYVGAISSDTARSELHQSTSGPYGKLMTPTKGKAVFLEFEGAFKAGKFPAIH